MTKPTRTLITLIIVNLGAALTFAALTPAFAGPILAYRQVREPGAGRIHLTAELLTRPLQAVLIAVLYVFVLRALAGGSGRAYRRVRIFSVLGMISTGWVLVSGQYPLWLSPLEVLQTLTAIAVFVAANSRAVRAEFGSARCAPLVCEPAESASRAA